MNYLRINLKVILTLLLWKIGKQNWPILRKQIHINYLKRYQKFEKYFDYIKNVKYLKAFIKFRVSDHKLLIEEGRRKHQLYQERNEYVKLVIKSKMKVIF